MKLFIILISTLFFAQDLSAENGATIYEKEFEEIVLPLISSYHELTNLIEEVKEYEVSSQVLAEEVPNFLPELPLIEAWDADACSKLPEELNKAANLASNITAWVFNAAQKYGKKLYDLLHCGSGTPDAILKCIIQDVSDMKRFGDLDLTDLKKFRAEVDEAAKRLGDQLKKCLSVRTKTKPAVPAKVGKKPLYLGNL
uniref:Uncharacterized protein n=1 Tax=Rhodnius prolixus TaxID=13249 RepID=T1I0S5_RHOPR